MWKGALVQRPTPTISSTLAVMVGALVASPFLTGCGDNGKSATPTPTQSARTQASDDESNSSQAPSRPSSPNVASLDALVSANSEPFEGCGTMSSGEAKSTFENLGAINAGETFCDSNASVSGIGAAEFSSNAEARTALADPSLLDSPKAVNVGDRTTSGNTVCLAQRFQDQTVTTCAAPAAQYIVYATGTDASGAEAGLNSMIDWVQAAG